jgi:hypothetical protein
MSGVRGEDADLLVGAQHAADHRHLDQTGGEHGDGHRIRQLGLERGR